MSQPTAQTSVGLAAESGHLLARAAELAERLSLPLLTGTEDAHQSWDFHLIVTDKRLELREPGSRCAPLYVDFIHGQTAHRRISGQSRKQPLARAVGIQGGDWSVWDATAGLGRDAFLLACLGCRVTAIERSPVLFGLLADALERARRTPDAKLAAIMARMTLVHADARTILANLSALDRPDVVYIDPMFPARKKSALEGREMRVCRALVGADEDAGELLAAARRVARRRVVVKRHRHAPPLGKPDFEITGRSVRYDVFLVPDPGP